MAARVLDLPWSLYDVPRRAQWNAPVLKAAAGVRGIFNVSHNLIRCMMHSPVSMKWDFSTVADHLAKALWEAEEELRLEQAVYGLDARDERALQSLLADRICAHYGVAREVHYPSSRGNKLTHRMRCDLVLSPKGKLLRLDRSPWTGGGSPR
jgi:hypothetical protein